MADRIETRAIEKRKTKTWIKNFIFAISISFFCPSPISAAEKLTIGVAANFILAFRELSQSFEKITSVTVEATYTSSGNLYGQIINGAPYDLFLSADEARPQRLFNEGLAETPFVYARGKVVLWALDKELCKIRDWREVLMVSKVKRVAIANPETAPYGAASAAALKAVSLWSVVEPRLVFAQNIAQVFQYAHTGSVDAGFCAFSSVFSGQGKEGCYFLVNQAPDVIQAACIFKRTKNRKAAKSFEAFLNSSEAEKIKTKYGYE